MTPKQQTNVCPECGVPIKDWDGKIPWNLRRHFARCLREVGKRQGYYQDYDGRIKYAEERPEEGSPLGER